MLLKKIAIASAILTVAFLQISFARRATATGTTVPPNPSCAIKGNISHTTGNKLYHLPGMRDYNITVIDMLRGEKWFCTEAQALSNGWKKAPR
ncbi:sunset domain-containing protein [Limnofasciculus baicalensis]|uniref:SH3b domain-containing protein n=1 Tax=Limnofasciculus baicalensis BBK-W-15 TaxID=2699891 RepID=A0AAE3KQ81_9CYAN|nr:hypothetical protein [Limnofasciculus baicalensis]MCP2730423.1 hypothetical protein [Limnofasciculus baicalensis BBK-W-15]